MEKFQTHEINAQLLHLLLLLLQILSLHCHCLDYSRPNKHFINCGSNANFSYTGRTFVGDESSHSFTLSPKQKRVKDGSPSPRTIQLYQTARVFDRPSTYEFDIDQKSTYVVRLHFFPFSSPVDLSRAVFNVSLSGLRVLMCNFVEKNSSNSPVIMEFLLSLDIGKFRVKFGPSQESFAFVNAIEVFLAPPRFIPPSASLVTSAGKNSSNCEVMSSRSRVLHTIHRINVGGDNIGPDSDNLWRNWVLDDPYLSDSSTAKNHTADGGLNYQVEPSEYKYIAPDPVYTTGKEMNKKDRKQLEFFNISWGFKVTKNARHLLRAHFCDIFSPSLSETPLFNLYIYSNFSKEINLTHSLREPFYLDFVVVSDHSGLLNISVGPRPSNEASLNNAFLNGLEIMEIMEGLSLDSMINESMAKDSKKNHIPILVGAIVGAFALVCFVVAVFWCRSKCRKEKPAEASDWLAVTVDDGLSSHKKVNEGNIYDSPVPHLNLGLKISFAEIQSATKNFSTNLLVGEGGFGRVYRGALRNGMEVAVKRSQPGQGQGLPEFQTEILILSKIRHRHLVTLIGYCDERNEMILVYEFMEKGTLRNHLYGSDLPCLSWKQRLEICIGAARGLHYLHTGSEGGIIHRDIKSTNILLDGNFVAKVADFGLSRLGLPHQAHVSTAVKGTFGYLDPEYFRTLQLTDKSDVYSFGVVLLEVLCARPSINPALPWEQVNLAEWAMLWQKKGSLEQIIDPLLAGQVDLKSLRKFGETAEKCLQEDGGDRPTMGDVIWDLDYALQLQQTAMQREPLDDSIIDPASPFPFPNVQLYHSYSSSSTSTDMIKARPYASETTESEVFSQLRIDDD